MGIAASSISSTIASATDRVSLSKPTIKPAVHKKPSCINLVDALGNTAPSVLLLSHCDKCGGVGALDADENPDKICPVQQQQQFEIIREIDRSFSGEFERIAARLLATSPTREETP